MKSLVAGAAVTLGLALIPSLGTAAPAPDRPSPEPQPTPAARAAGIDRAGIAYMGWATPDGTTSTASTVSPSAVAAAVYGIDVSSHQGNVNWSYWWNQGKRFAYVKATESTTYKNPYFAQQYNGSYNVGMIRGAYHFALPDRSTGATQADYFVNNGGGWSRDGKTLPGALDIEYNPYGATCYGKTASAMVSWISSFVQRYKYRTGRDAVIYSNYDWWSRCTGNSTAFRYTNPLWVARYSSTVGTLPGGWPYYTFWQYSSSPIDQDVFNGDYSRLQALANG